MGTCVQNTRELRLMGAPTYGTCFSVVFDFHIPLSSLVCRVFRLGMASVCGSGWLLELFASFVSEFLLALESFRLIIFLFCYGALDKAPFFVLCSKTAELTLGVFLSSFRL